MQHEPFVALDFETSHHAPDSACSVALVRVEHGAVVETHHTLLQPPYREPWMFTHVHGIRRSDVAQAPTFAQAWPTLVPLLAGVQRVVAHNAPFDRGVLAACSVTGGVPLPRLSFHCSARGARRAFQLRNAPLKTACAHLGIPLDRHHDALCDAQACAQVWLAVLGVLGAEAWGL